MASFQQRVDAEEANIALAIQIALRDCAYLNSKFRESYKKTTEQDSLDTAGQDPEVSHSTKPATKSAYFSITAMC